MSSATSTDTVSLKPDSPQALHPWQFFALAALIGATALAYLIRGQGIGAVVLMTVLMGTVALVGVAMLRAIRPLVLAEEDKMRVAGGRTRAALEREKHLVLRAIKELEFDRSMGKISDEDFREMSGRLRVRAAGLIRQLDAGEGYRHRIEKDLAKRLDSEPSAAPMPKECSRCSTVNDDDAKFCRACGQALQ
jgi:hypothetical protein